MIVSLYIRKMFLLTWLPQKKNYVVDFHVELNFSNELWLLISRTTQIKLAVILMSWVNTLICILQHYEKVLIQGDFNFGIEEQHMKSFCENCNFYKITNKL